MSLDVYLNMKNENYKQIYIREEGQTKEMTLDEWNDSFQNKRLQFEDEDNEKCKEVYRANITHNLADMASEVGIYKHLWRPDEINIKKASQLIDPLTEGLQLLNKEPERFKKFNPDNGWGSYDGLVRFVRNYRDVCKEYPDADVLVSR